jgi:hypothetical protein
MRKSGELITTSELCQECHELYRLRYSVIVAGARLQNASPILGRVLALQNGFISLKRVAAENVPDGITTIDEFNNIWHDVPPSFVDFLHWISLSDNYQMSSFFIRPTNSLTRF